MKNTYVVLLRGINVSGQKKIKMTDLRGFLEEVNFYNVRTYIQSGNIILESNISDIQKIANKVSQLIKDKYGFDVPTVVKRKQDLLDVVSNDPFTERVEVDHKRVYVTFLNQSPTYELIEKLKQIECSPEEWIVNQDCIYFYSPEDYGRAKMSNNFFEQKLKVSATTRNWRTVNTLIDMA